MRKHTKSDDYYENSYKVGDYDICITIKKTSDVNDVKYEKNTESVGTDSKDVKSAKSKRNVRNIPSYVENVEKDPRCPYCIANGRLYCFFDPEWKSHVPLIDFSGYSLQRKVVYCLERTDDPLPAPGKVGEHEEEAAE